MAVRNPCPARTLSVFVHLLLLSVHPRTPHPHTHTPPLSSFLRNVWLKNSNLVPAELRGKGFWPNVSWRTAGAGPLRRGVGAATATAASDQFMPGTETARGRGGERERERQGERGRERERQRDNREREDTCKRDCRERPRSNWAVLRQIQDSWGQGDRMSLRDIKTENPEPLRSEDKRARQRGGESREGRRPEWVGAAAQTTRADADKAPTTRRMPSSLGASLALTHVVLTWLLPGGDENYSHFTGERLRWTGF